MAIKMQERGTAGTKLLEAVEDNIISFYLQVRRALKECSDEVRSVIDSMFDVIDDPESDRDEVEMAMSTIREALFPGILNGSLGAELTELEAHQAADCDEAADVIHEMDAEEASFSDRVRAVMEMKAVTQTELADRVGLNQSAISMMLSRQARPQRRTIQRLAKALGVPPQDLWPDGE